MPKNLKIDLKTWHYSLPIVFILFQAEFSKNLYIYIYSLKNHDNINYTIKCHSQALQLYCLY